MSLTRRTFIVIVATAGAVVASTAVAFAGRTDPAPRPDAPLAYAPTAPPRAGDQPSGDADAVLAAVLTRLDPGVIVSARLGQAPSSQDWQGRWLYATLNVPKVGDGLEIEPEWEADLAQGAVAESVASGADLADAVVGSTFDARLPDGTTVPGIGGGAGEIATHQVFSVATDAEITASLEATLRGYGLMPIKITVLRPLGPAPRIVASGDPAALAGSAERLRRALTGDPVRYEGLFLELRDPSGQAYLRMSASYRTSAGRLWVRPGLGVDLGTAHG